MQPSLVALKKEKVRVHIELFYKDFIYTEMCQIFVVFLVTTSSLIFEIIALKMVLNNFIKCIVFIATLCNCV